MSAWITGLGLALPPHRIAQMDAAEIAQHFSCETDVQRRQFLTLYRWAGVETRHCVVLDASEGELDARQSFYDQGNDPTTGDRIARFEREAGPLAVAAGRAALVDADLPADRITHLITVTCSGFHAPGFDVALIKGLGLPAETSRTQLGFMGCHGALNGLRVARAYIEADPSARVLLCALELCSLHHQYRWDPEQIVANALFGDGAAAVVVEAPHAVPDDAYRLRANGATLIPDSEDAMTWRIGDNGFRMTLSTGVPHLIERNLRPWLSDWLARHDLTIDTVGSWAVHPGGPRILAVVREALGLPREAMNGSYEVLAEAGNMSSPTVLFILDRLRRARAPRPCVALGFGPGLAVEAAILA